MVALSSITWMYHLSISYDMHVVKFMKSVHFFFFFLQILPKVYYIFIQDAQKTLKTYLVPALVTEKEN